MLLMDFVHVRAQTTKVQLSENDNVSHMQLVNFDIT